MYEKFLPFLHTYKFTFNKTKQSPRKGIYLMQHIFMSLLLHAITRKHLIFASLGLNRFFLAVLLQYAVHNIFVSSVEKYVVYARVIIKRWT